ncbi:MAG TPA: hypothetical protein VGH56_04605, partial [Solirubrobacteraceae bacterium]
MTPMKKRTMIAITLGAWLAALGSASALTYELSRPLHFAPATSVVPVPPHATLAGVRAPAAAQLPALAPVLYMPPVTIIAPRLPAAAMKAPVVRETPPMLCSDWRVLDMGSGRVRTCE